MDFLLDLLQGAGLAAAIGIRPFLPVLLAGALAAADLGLDFGGTDFSFLERWPFLLAVLLAVAALDLAVRQGGDTRTLPFALGGLALILGALEAAGSVADRGNSVAIAIPVGVACAALGFWVARQIFTRVRKRLDSEAASALPVYAEGVALAVAGASILFPPLALLVLVGLGFLLAGGRRRQDEKYAGLRILR